MLAMVEWIVAFRARPMNRGHYSTLFGAIGKLCDESGEVSGEVVDLCDEMICGCGQIIHDLFCTLYLRQQCADRVPVGLAGT